jgi:cyclophilin family peptidyl-prolyl cis-trans isomerase
MKKYLFIFMLAFLLSGCGNSTNPTTFNEKSIPAGNFNDNQDQAMQRINDINNGATPKVSPDEGKQSPALNSINNQNPGDGAQSAASPSTDNKIKLDNLAKEYRYAVLKTNFGDIKLSFYPNEAPLAVNNFLNLAQKGFYDGVLFHRVIKDFMIQGGDPKSKDRNATDMGTGGPGYQFQDEISDHKLVQGSLAMANSGPNTNGSQFFIVTKEATPWLDGSYTNFGYVVEGLDVALKIDQAKTDSSDRPLEDVIINKVVLEK